MIKVFDLIKRLSFNKITNLLVIFEGNTIYMDNKVVDLELYYNLLLRHNWICSIFVIS